MINKQECDQCSGTELIQHEGAEDWMLCLQCGNSTKIEKAEWVCGNEMRWLEEVEKKHNPQKWNDAKRFVELGRNANAYSIVFPERVKAIEDKGKSLIPHIRNYQHSEIVRETASGMANEYPPQRILQQKWIDQWNNEKWVDVPEVNE